MKSDLRSVKSFLVTSKEDVIRIGTDKTSINAANLVKAYSDFVVDCPVTAEAQKVARSHGLPEFNLCVSASSGKYKGFIRLIAGKTSYGFDLKASNKHTAMRQIEAVFDDIFSGNVISEFEFYDKSVLHASANSHVSVYDTFVPQVGRGKAAFYADRFKRMGSKGSNTQVCHYAKVCASKEADVVMDYPKRVSVAHTFVNASGMSRVVQHLNKALTGEGTVAIFTAFQKMGKGSTIDLEKNEKNYRELGRILDNLQNGAIPMDGYWQGTAEKSYLVPNLSLELAKALNARYHQWAFIYAGPETAGKFEFYATPDNYGTKEDYVVSATWDNYAVEGLKDPQGYSEVDDRKFSFYEGGDTPEEYMNAVMELNKWANNVIDSVKVSYTEKDRENRTKEKRDKMKDMVAARKRKAGTDIISDSDRPKTSPAFYKVWKLGVSQEKPEVLFNKISRKKWQEYIKENSLNFVPEDSPTALVSGHYNDKEGNAFFIGYPDQESPMGVTSAVDTYYFPAEKATDKVVSRTESLGSGFYFCKDKQEALDLFGAVIPVKVTLKNPFDLDKGIPDGAESTKAFKSYEKKVKESGSEDDIVDVRDAWEDNDTAGAIIKELGYDGVTNLSLGGSNSWVVVFDRGSFEVTEVKAGRHLTSAFGKKAYWISPSGEVIDCATTHISEVINKPEQFGLTREGIEELYKQYDEPLGHEGKAREEIMLDLIKKGWTRIRWVPSKYSWTVQIADLTKRVMDNLQNWAMSIITSDEGLKNTDVTILPVNEGVPQSFHPLKDIAADVLYRTVEANLLIPGNYPGRYEVYVDGKVVKKFDDDIAALKYLEDWKAKGSSGEFKIVDTDTKHGKTVVYDRNTKSLVTASKQPESVYVENMRDKGVAKATWFEDKGQYYVKFSDGSDGYFKKDDLDFNTGSVKASKLPSFKVTFENGDTLVTSMAAGITLEDAKNYYIGRSFTFGTGEEGNPERQVKAVDVEQIGFASEASKIPTTLEEVKQAYGEVPANVKFEFGDTLKVYFNGTAEDTVSYVDKIKKDLGDLVSVTNKPKGFFTESAKDGDLVLEKIETKEGYDYYIGVDTDGSYVYNVVREGIPAPKTGYYRSQYICDLRGVPNIFDEFEKEGTRTEDTISDPRQ